MHRDVTMPIYVDKIEIITTLGHMASTVIAPGIGDSIAIVPKSTSINSAIAMAPTTFLGDFSTSPPRIHLDSVINIDAKAR